MEKTHNLLNWIYAGGTMIAWKLTTAQSQQMMVQMIAWHSKESLDTNLLRPLAWKWLTNWLIADCCVLIYYLFEEKKNCELSTRTGTGTQLQQHNPSDVEKYEIKK